jgi:Flp pilus assembly pilin Flp
VESLYQLTRRALRREQGQTTAEYAIVMAVIITAIVAVLAAFGGMVGDHIQTIADRIPGA